MALERLAPFDRALALRERGAQHYTSGDLVEASEILELCWALAHEAAAGEALLPAIGLALGLSYAARGFDRRASHSCEAALARAHPARAAHLRTARALCLVHLGELDRAEADLRAAAETGSMAPVAAPYLQYVTGVLQTARGRLALADAAYAASAAAARAAQEPETEAYAELGRCAVATACGHLDAAAGHLARARCLMVTDRLEALVLLREGVLLTHRLERREAGRGS